MFYKKDNGLLKAQISGLTLDHFETPIDCSLTFDISQFKEWTNPEFLLNEQYGKVILDFEITNPQNNNIISESNITMDQKASLFKALFIPLHEYYEKERLFIQYHFTGFISGDVYKQYTIDYSIDRFPKPLLSFTDKSGEVIELRQENEKLKYVKKDKNNEIVRDKDGLALYLSDEEVLEKKLLLYSPTIVAFNSNQKSVGLASDEFGADGIWVNSDYQNRGIGLVLLTEFRKQFSDDRQMGQMTASGINLARMYYRSNVLKLK